jgi:hypothetical protein
MSECACVCLAGRCMHNNDVMIIIAETITNRATSRGSSPLLGTPIKMATVLDSAVRPSTNHSSRIKKLLYQNQKRIFDFTLSYNKSSIL